MSRRTAVDQNVCAWDGGHPGLTVWNLLNYKRIETAHKVRKKTSVFYCVIVICTTTGRTDRHGEVGIVMINQSELPIID